MPIVDVSIGRGRSPEQVRDLISQLTAATCSALACDPAAVRVLVRELPWTHWAAGDRTMAEVRAEEGRTDPGPAAAPA